MPFSPFQQDTKQMAPHVVEERFQRKPTLHWSHIIPKLFRILVFVSTIRAAGSEEGAGMATWIFEVFTV